MRMKGEDSKSLGNFGNYEIGAKWHWKLHFNTITVVLLALSVTLALIISAGFMYFWFQLAELSRTKAAIMEMQEKVLQVHEALLFEIEEVRQLKKDFLLNQVTDVAVDREKRSALLGKGGNIGSNNTKQIKKPPKVKKLASSQSSTLNRHKPHSFHVSAIHLERANVNFFETGSNGIITRWNPQYFSESPDSIAQLADHNSSLVIQTSGLYLVYAQLCYAATKENNSFEIRLVHHGGSIDQSKIIAQCSAGTSVSQNEITCYTSVAQVLQPGDRVYLQQVQKKRQVFMNMGRSFMGVIKLSN